MEIIWYLEFMLRFAVNLTSTAILIYGIYTKRHYNSNTATSAMILNVFVFSILTVLASVQFSLAAGFGLFAILALFTLRSEQLNRIDISYYFGSISFAVLFSINSIDYGLMLIITATILTAVYILDHPKFNSNINTMKVRLDAGKNINLSNRDDILNCINTQIGVQAKDYKVIKVCNISETLELEIEY
jgi:hypothetical protein